MSSSHPSAPSPCTATKSNAPNVRNGEDCTEVGDHATAQRASYRRIGGAHRQEGIVQELADLRQSHARMMMQISRLGVEISQTRQRSLETERIVRGPHNPQERALRRTIMFATVSSLRVLRGNHPEVTKSYSAVIQANSIRQIVLKAKGVDCTLFDFRLLASYFLRQENIHCTLDPPEKYALLCSTMHAKTFTARFEMFEDIAEALQIPSDTRCTSAYQEKKFSTGQLRCIRILGVDNLRYGNIVGIPHESESDEAESRPLLQRKVLIGRSVLAATDEVLHNVHVLHQDSCSWTYPSWDVGFVYQEDNRSALKDFEAQSTSKTTAFIMKWERSSESPYPRDSSPELIPGTLKCFFPAVVLRSRILTDTTRSIFSVNPDGTSLLRKIF